MAETGRGFAGYRFGMFELDLQARELRRRGIRVKLQEKPFQILEAVLGRPGELITRAELRQKLWPDTFVGFDRSLNTAVNSLRKALGDLAESPRFLETRTRLGYRFIAPVQSITQSSRGSLQNHDVLDSIAVLPFQNSNGDPDMEYLSDGISETLIDTLSQLPGIRVMARTTVFRYKGREVDTQTIGQELNVRALLTGKVSLRKDMLTIGAELVDTAQGWRLWGEQYNRKLSDIFAVQDEISREIAEKLRLRLAREARARLHKHYTSKAGAYQSYLRGRYHWNKTTPEEVGKGIGYFEHAIREDPQFALAYAGLADSYGLFGFFGIHPSKEVMPKAEEFARKALELDDTLAEAHVALAGVLKSYHWDWLGAEQEYRQALDLNPNYATAHRWYGALLMNLGRSAEAIQEMERALELDPFSLIINMELGWVHYMARDYGQALEQALKTIDIEPQFLAAHHILGLAYERMGKHKEAITAFKKAHSGSAGNPISLAGLARAYAIAGRKGEARKILTELGERAKRGYTPYYVYSVLYLALDEKTQGLKWLERACDERDPWLIWVLQDPRLDSVRQDPRFSGVLRRMNFPLKTQVAHV
jgi:TolB-like protein/tetratricopeptide (TPR) repeat protein